MFVNLTFLISLLTVTELTIQLAQLNSPSTDTLKLIPQSPARGVRECLG